MEDYKIGCIMLTCKGREKFLSKGIDYFLRQTWHNKELYIIGDSDKLVENTTAFPIETGYPNVYRVDIAVGHGIAPLTIGAKRNIACSLAFHCDIIAHQDDDDVYGPLRLAKQARPLLHDNKYLTGLDMGVALNTNTMEGYRVDATTHAKMFHADIHGGTLMYWRDVWKQCMFPDVNVGEDAEFIRSVEKIGTIGKVSNDNDFVYVRHGSNAWSFTLGQHIDSDGWTKVDVEGIMPQEDLTFYRNLQKISNSYS